MAVGPTGKEQNIFGTFEIPSHALDACTTQLTSATALAPAFAELDGAATSLTNTFKAYADVINKAYTYYDQQNYKDDNFEQGKALHTEIVKTYEAFKADADKFEAELDKANTAAQIAALAEVEKAEGKKFAYWSLATSIKAKEAADLLSEEKFDIEKATTLVAELETNATEFKNYIGTKAQDVPIGVDVITTNLDDFVSAAKKRVRRVRDNEPYADDEKLRLSQGGNIAAMVDGSEAQVVYKYNQLIQMLNTIH